MAKAMKCAGYVAGFAAIAAGGMVTFFSVFALVIWLANATAAFLGWPENTAGLFGVIYIATFAGGMVGAIYCWCNR